MLLGWLLGAPGSLALGLALLAAPLIWTKPVRLEVVGLLLLTLVGHGLFGAGLAFLARGKGRSGWWGLLGPSFVVGLALLWLLPDRCGWCGRLEPRSRLRCPACAGPL
jgi:hypothetical protein